MNDRRRRVPKEPSRVSVRAAGTAARERFLEADTYRVQREWLRYEGTAQRELFRELRLRFLERHRAPGRWALDVGSGPGRFTRTLGARGIRRIALDLSREMLGRAVRDRPSPLGDAVEGLELVQGDGLAPPFAANAFDTVALLGNVVGFAGAESERILSAAESLVAPGGTLLLELAPGPGERSIYLSRLPPGSVARLLAAPPRAIVPRIDREGFVTEPERHPAGEFRRFRVDSLIERWKKCGFETLESIAVAPSLGPEADRLTRVRADPKAWSHLLEVEETIGRRSDRWRSAAAVLLATRRIGSGPPPLTHLRRPDGPDRLLGGRATGVHAIRSRAQRKRTGSRMDDDE